MNLPVAKLRRIRSLDNFKIVDIKIEIYSKPDCSLCDKAKTVIEKVKSQRPLTISEIDISKDPILFEKYKEKIPVIFINGKQAFVYKVHETVLRKKLDILSIS